MDEMFFEARLQDKLGKSMAFTDIAAAEKMMYDKKVLAVLQTSAFEDVQIVREHREKDGCDGDHRPNTSRPERPVSVAEFICHLQHCLESCEANIDDEEHRMEPMLNILCYYLDLPMHIRQTARAVAIKIACLRKCKPNRQILFTSLAIASRQQFQEVAKTKSRVKTKQTDRVKPIEIDIMHTFLFGGGWFTLEDCAESEKKASEEVTQDFLQSLTSEKPTKYNADADPSLALIREQFSGSNGVPPELALEKVQTLAGRYQLRQECRTDSKKMTLTRLQAWDRYREDKIVAGLEGIDVRQSISTEQGN